MKFLKNILLQSMCLCLIAIPLIARHKKDDATQMLLDSVNQHEPGKIAYDNIINPTVVGLSNPEELEKPRKALSHDEKVEKYKTDKELQNIFHRDANHLTEGQLLTSRQALNFFNLDIHEQLAQIKKWLKNHNVHQNNELKNASKEYREEIKNFKGSTQHETLKNVAKIQRAMQDRDDQIQNLKKQIAKGNLSESDQHQKQQEINRLVKQNQVDDDSIQQQLKAVLNKLQTIDAEFKQSCDQVLLNYQEKNHNFLDTVNNIVTSKKQIFSFKIDDKHLPAADSSELSKINNLKIATTPVNGHSVILSESMATLIKNPILDKIIQRHEQDLMNMKKNSPDYKIMKEELKRLKLARNLRDIQGTSISQ